MVADLDFMCYCMYVLQSSKLGDSLDITGVGEADISGITIGTMSGRI